MTDTIRTAQLEASVAYLFDEVAADVRDRRADSLSLFGDLDEAQREQLVVDAWSIGVRAFHNAHFGAGVEVEGRGRISRVGHQPSAARSR